MSSIPKRVILPTSEARISGYTDVRSSRSTQNRLVNLHIYTLSDLLLVLKISKQKSAATVLVFWFVGNLRMFESDILEVPSLIGFAVKYLIGRRLKDELMGSPKESSGIR